MEKADTASDASLWLTYATPEDVQPMGEFIQSADPGANMKRFAMGSPSSGRVSPPSYFESAGIRTGWTVSVPMWDKAMPPWLAFMTPQDARPLGEFIELPGESLYPKTFMAALSSGRTPPSLTGRISIVPRQLITCTKCKSKPLIGERYECLQCIEYMLCPKCEAQDPGTFHPPDHVFAKIRPPV